VLVILLQRSSGEIDMGLHLDRAHCVMLTRTLVQRWMDGFTAQATDSLLSLHHRHQSSSSTESSKVLLTGSAANQHCGITALGWPTCCRSMVRRFTLHTNVIVTRLAGTTCSPLVSDSLNWTFTPRTLPQMFTHRQC